MKVSLLRWGITTCLLLFAYAGFSQVKNDFDVRYANEIRGDLTFIANNIVNRDSNNRGVPGRCFCQGHRQAGKTAGLGSDQLALSQWTSSDLLFMLEASARTTAEQDNTAIPANHNNTLLIRSFPACS